MTQPKRVPIATFKNGHTLEPSRKFHAEWELPKLLGGGDNSVWICLRTSEAPRTAVLPVRQPNRELPKTYNPAIGKIKLDPDTCGRSRHRGYSIGDVFKAFNRFTKNTVK